MDFSDNQMSATTEHTETKTEETTVKAKVSSSKSDTDDKKWFVVRAISGKEKKIKQSIDSEIKRLKMGKFVLQVLIPTEKVFQIRAGKKISKERNFFPGYILVEAVLSGEVPHIIRNVPGVLGFLGTKTGDPIPLRLAEVNRILGKVDELAESTEKISIPFYVGDTVKIQECRPLSKIIHFVVIKKIKSGEMKK